VWVRQDFSRGETGGLHGLGLAGLGFDPGTLVLVQVHDALGVLRAGLEAARCPALGAAVIEPWGKPRLLDFTATRRLKLAAAKSGVPCLLLRLDAQPEPSAASTRWRVAASFSEPLAAGAPGPAAFDITLLRHRTGMAGQAWRLEWNHEYRVFREAPPLPGAVAALPAGWPAQPAISSLARSA
jgi:protein ImuA